MLGELWDLISDPAMQLVWCLAGTILAFTILAYKLSSEDVDPIRAIGVRKVVEAATGIRCPTHRFVLWPKLVWIFTRGASRVGF
jgi:hypothetical protein